MTHLPIYGHVGAVIILWHHTCTLDPQDRTTLKENLRSGTGLMTHQLSMAHLATYKSFKSKQWTGFCDSLWLVRHPPDVGGSGYDVAHSIRLKCHTCMLFPLEVPFINIATMVQLLVYAYTDTTHHYNQYTLYTPLHVCTMCLQVKLFTMGILSHCCSFYTRPVRVHLIMP